MSAFASAVPHALSNRLRSDAFTRPSPLISAGLGWVQSSSRPLWSASSVGVRAISRRSGRSSPSQSSKLVQRRRAERVATPASGSGKTSIQRPSGPSMPDISSALGKTMLCAGRSGGQPKLGTGMALVVQIQVDCGWRNPSNHGPAQSNAPGWSQSASRKLSSDWLSARASVAPTAVASALASCQDHDGPSITTSARRPPSPPALMVHRRTEKSTTVAASAVAMVLASVLAAMLATVLATVLAIVFEIVLAMVFEIVLAIMSVIANAGIGACKLIVRSMTPIRPFARFMLANWRFICKLHVWTRVGHSCGRLVARRWLRR